MGKKRVAVIGLDGMAWHIIDKLFEYDAMPFLKRTLGHSIFRGRTGVIIGWLREWLRT